MFIRKLGARYDISLADAALHNYFQITVYAVALFGRFLPLLGRLRAAIFLGKGMSLKDGGGQSRITPENV